MIRTETIDRKRLVGFLNDFDNHKNVYVYDVKTDTSFKILSVSNRGDKLTIDIFKGVKKK